MSTVETVPQPRHAAGSNVGGQFAAKKTSAPGGTLAPAGSFLFPPRMTTAAELGSFLSEAEISDRVLSNAQYTYRQWWDAEWAAIRERHIRTWEDANMRQVARWQSGGQKGAAALQAKADELAREGDALARKNLPEQNPAADTLRNVMVARQIQTQAALLPSAEEREQAKKYPVDMPNGATAAGDLADWYRAAAWGDRAMTESDVRSIDTMEKMTTAISGSMETQTEIHRLYYSTRLGIPRDEWKI